MKIDLTEDFEEINLTTMRAVHLQLRQIEPGA